MPREPRKRTPAEPKVKKRTPKKGLTTEELRRRHMSDPNHNISEEDLKSVQIETNVEPGDVPDLPEGDERPHDVDKDHRIKTPWDIRRDS